MTDITDLSMEVDTSDLDAAARKVDSFAESTKKAAASSALFGSRIADGYGLSAQKMQQVARSVAQLRAQEIRQERARSSMIMQASAGVIKIKERELAASERAAKVVAAQEASAIRQRNAEARRVAQLLAFEEKQKRAFEQSVASSNKAAEAQIAASKRLEKQQDAAARAEYARILRLERERSRAAASAAKAAAAEQASIIAQQNAESKRISDLLKFEAQQKAAFMRSVAAREKAARDEIRIEEAKARRVASILKAEAAQRAAFEKSLREKNGGGAFESDGRGILATLSSIRGTMLSLSGIMAGFGVVALYGALNQYTELTNILKVLGFEGEQAGKKLREIQQIAAQTRSPVNELAKVYQKTTMASVDLGASQEQILEFTRNVGLALAQQGGATAATKGALLQLSQAIGMGSIKAEEFNSLMEGAYPILVAVAKGIDKTGGSVMKLRQMVLDQELSSKMFFDALLSQSKQLQEAYAKTTPTLSQGFQVFKDSIMIAAGEMDHALGFSAALSKGLITLASSVTSVGNAVADNTPAVQNLAQGLAMLSEAAAAILLVKAVSAIRAAGGAFYALGVAVGFAAKMLKAFLPALAVVALIDIGRNIKNVIDGSDEYNKALKDSKEITEDFWISAKEFSDKATQDSSAAMLAMSEVQIKNLEAQRDALQKTISGERWLGGDIFHPEEMRNAERRLEIINLELQTTRQYSQAAGDELRRMALEAAGIQSNVDGVSDKVVEASAELISSAKEQIQLNRAIQQYGKESAEVAAITRDIAIREVESKIAQKKITGDLAVETRNIMIAAYDSKVELEAAEAVTKRWADVAKNVLSDFNKLQESVANNRREAENSIEAFRAQEAMSRTILKYGQDSAQVESLKRQQAEQTAITLMQQQGITGKLADDYVRAAMSAYDADYAVQTMNGSLRTAGGLAAQLVSIMGQVPGAIAALAGEVDGMIGALERQNTILSFQVKDKMSSSAANIRMMRNEAVEAALAAGKTADEAAKIGEAFDPSIAKADELSRSIDSQSKALTERNKAENAGSKAKKKSAGASKAEKDALAELNKELAHRKSLIGMFDEEIEARNIVKSVTDKLTEGEKKYTKEAIAGAVKRSLALAAEEKMWDKTKQAISSISDAIGEVVMNGFTTFEDFASSVLDVFKNMLAEMISTAVRNPVRIFVNTVMSSLGIPGSGLAAGGDPLTAALQGAGLPATGGGGGIGSLLGSLSGGFGAGFGSFFKGFGTSLAGGGGLLGSLGGGVSGLMSSLGGGAAGLGSLGGIATALGAASFIFAGVGAVISLGKKMFGRTLKDTGIEATFNLAEGLAAKTYKFYKGGWFRSDKTRRSSLDRSIADPIERAFQDIGNSILDMTETLGQDVGDALNFDFKFKFSTKGKSEEEIQQMLQEQLDKYASEASLHAIPELERFLKVGESAYDGLTRLSQALTAANAGFDMIGQTLYDASVVTADMASNLADLFGGVDAMSSAVENYFQLFYTESEQLDYLRRMATEQLKAVGKTLPTTRAAYRESIDNLDLTTQSGREAYAVLIGLASAIDKLIPVVDGLSDAILDMFANVSSLLSSQTDYANEMINIHEQLAKDWYAAAKSIRDVVNDLRYDDNTSQNSLSYSRAQYESAYNAALGGDLTAAQNVGDYAKTYQEQLLKNVGSGVEYDRAIAKMMSELELVAGASELEGAKEDVMVYLYEQQIEILQSIEALLQASTLTGEDYEALSQPMKDALADFDGTMSDFTDALDSIEQALTDVGNMSYRDIMNQLDINVNAIENSELSRQMKNLLLGATDGIRANVDFIVRSDLPPDLKFIAITQQSEHLKTVKFLTENNLGVPLTRLALASVSELQKNIRFIIRSDLTVEDKRLLLTTNSTLARNINVLLSNTSDPRAIRLGLERIMNKTVRIRAFLDDGIPPAIRRALLSSGGLSSTITLGGNFVFNPSEAFRVWYGAQTRNLVNPMNNLRTAIQELREAMLEETRRQERARLEEARRTAIFNANSTARDEMIGLGGGRYVGTESQILKVARQLGIDTQGKTIQQIANQVAAFDSSDNINQITATETQFDYLWRVFQNRAGQIPLDTADYLTVYDDLRRVSPHNYYKDPEKHYRDWGREEILSGRRPFSPRVFDWEAIGISAPGFAAGGLHSGGLRIVGEKGPELEVTGPSRIHSATQTADLLNNDAMLVELQNLRKEVRQLRDENNAGNAQVIKQTRKTSDTLNKWDIDGQPLERDSA